MAVDSRTEQLRQVVEAAMLHFAEMTKRENIQKLTVADFIRLAQFHQEMWRVEPKEIRVKWVENPPATESGFRS
jgi:hypothetical protein